MRPQGILETVLYCPDLAAAQAFYTGVLGLRGEAWLTNPTDTGSRVSLSDDQASPRAQADGQRNKAPLQGDE